MKAPKEATRAYDAGRAYADVVDRARRERGGSSLRAYANTDAVSVAKRARRGDDSGAVSLARWLESGGVDAVESLGALAAAVRVPVAGDVVEAFWVHGLQGWHPPRWVRAWRFGGLPEGGRSEVARPAEGEGRGG